MARLLEAAASLKSLKPICDDEAQDDDDESKGRNPELISESNVAKTTLTALQLIPRLVLPKEEKVKKLNYVTKVMLLLRTETDLLLNVS